MSSFFRDMVYLEFGEYILYCIFQKNFPHLRKSYKYYEINCTSKVGKPAVHDNLIVK